MNGHTSAKPSTTEKWIDAPFRKRTNSSNYSNPVVKSHRRQDTVQKVRTLSLQSKHQCTGKHKLIAVIICCLLAIPTSIAAAERSNCRQTGPLVFGILPYISAEQLVYRFSPLANYLSEKLQVPVRIETAPHFIEFARRTHEDQHYDILFTAPHLYTQASRKAGFRLIVSIDSPDMWAVIVVPKQSDIQTIEDLERKQLATVHPLGLSTLLVRKRLLDAGIDPDVDLNLVITPSHDASLLSAYHGVTDASALMLPTFEASSKRVQESMRIIARTEKSPLIPISVGPRISDSCASEITSVLLNIGTTPEGRAVLEHNKFNGFRKANPDAYEKLDELLFR